jgi:hypothetical protein
MKRPVSVRRLLEEFDTRPDLLEIKILIKSLHSDLRTLYWFNFIGLFIAGCCIGRLFVWPLVELFFK